MSADRIAELERRLQALEDERAITRLLTSYGPLVDSGSAEEVAALWAEDGVYEVDGHRLSGRQELAAMVRSPEHRRLIGTGSAHFLGPSHVTVDGDTAVAVCHSLLVRRREDCFVVRRATAHHFELRREPDGWEITTRTSRLLDGSASARSLLGAGARGEPLHATTDRPPTTTRGEIR